jgi:hypothetical protein
VGARSGGHLALWNMQAVYPFLGIIIFLINMAKSLQSDYEGSKIVKGVFILNSPIRDVLLDLTSKLSYI